MDNQNKVDHIVEIKDMEVKRVDAAVPERKRGRRPYSPEEKAAALQRRTEYQAKYQAKYRVDHKEHIANLHKESHAKRIADKKYQCPTCGCCYGSPSMLKYHLTVSKAHTAG